MSLPLADIERALAITTADDSLVQLYFILRERRKDDTSYSIEQGKFTIPIGKEFKSVLSDKLSYLLEESELDIQLYDPTFSADRPTLEYLPLEKVAVCSDMVNLMRKPDEVDFAADIDADFFKSLWGFAVRISNGDEDVFYFRKYSKGKVLRSTGRLKLYFSKGVFTKLEQDVFNLDDKVDSIVFRNNVMIIDKNYFEQLFSFMEQYVPHATEAIEQLQAGGLIQGLEEMAEACISDSRKLKKLVGIIQTMNLSNLDFTKLKAVAEDFGIDVEFDSEEQKIIAARKNYWAILKLLADDLLSSPLTANKYEVQSKRLKR